MRNRLGTTLIELMVAAALSGGVLTTGYVLYNRLGKVDEVERHRETGTIVAQTLLSRIKSDVRAGSSVRASGERLWVRKGSETIVYSGLPGGAGVERSVHGARCRYKGVSCSFSGADPGVHVTLRSTEVVRRRLIATEIKTFVRPRNR